MKSDLTLVLGGARSGKSALAEKLARAAGGRLVYVATAQAHDTEMSERIEAHKLARKADGWTTIEEPLNVPSVLATASTADTILFDCATLWLTNHMLRESNLPEEKALLLQTLEKTGARVIVVSNETGLGIVPENALARRFRDEQGKLNQEIAEIAGLVVVVIAGLPLALKGALPEGL